MRRLAEPEHLVVALPPEKPHLRIQVQLRDGALKLGAEHAVAGHRVGDRSPGADEPGDGTQRVDDSLFLHQPRDGDDPERFALAQPPLGIGEPRQVDARMEHLDLESVAAGVDQPAPERLADGEKEVPLPEELGVPGIVFRVLAGAS